MLLIVVPAALAFSTIATESAVLLGSSATSLCEPSNADRPDPYRVGGFKTAYICQGECDDSLSDYEDCGAYKGDYAKREFAFEKGELCEAIMGCSDTCWTGLYTWYPTQYYAGDGRCDDGGPGAEYTACRCRRSPRQRCAGCGYGFGRQRKGARGARVLLPGCAPHPARGVAATPRTVQTADHAPVRPGLPRYLCSCSGGRRCRGCCGGRSSLNHACLRHSPKFSTTDKEKDSGVRLNKMWCGGGGPEPCVMWGGDSYVGQLLVPEGVGVKLYENWRCPDWSWQRDVLGPNGRDTNAPVPGFTIARV